MTDDANGFQLNRQRHDFQDVHYVVHGRESSAMIIWPNDPAAVAVVSCDVDSAVVEMILSSLASFFLVLRVRASPVFLVIFIRPCLKKETRNEEKKKIKVICFHKMTENE